MRFVTEKNGHWRKQKPFASKTMAMVTAISHFHCLNLKTQRSLGWFFVSWNIHNITFVIYLSHSLSFFHCFEKLSLSFKINYYLFHIILSGWHCICFSSLKKCYIIILPSTHPSDLFKRTDQPISISFHLSTCDDNIIITTATTDGPRILTYWGSVRASRAQK